MDELDKLKLERLTIERQNILNNRPDLHFMSDFTPEGNRLFEIDEEIDKINKEPNWESLRGKNLDKKLDKW